MKFEYDNLTLSCTIPSRISPVVIQVVCGDQISASNTLRHVSGLASRSIRAVPYKETVSILLKSRLSRSAYF